MSGQSEIRRGELAVALPEAKDAGLVFIGRIRTPWATRQQAPKRGSADGPVCRIELFEPWVQALEGLEDFQRVEVLYWLHLSRRDLVLQRPSASEKPHGTFSLRSPTRPNPIGTAIARLERVEPAALMVRGLDCVDGTPLLDLKPDRCAFAAGASADP